MAEDTSDKNRIGLAAIRARVESDASKHFWQSLKELAETPEYTTYLHHEFPHDPGNEQSTFSRRDALKLMAASAAMAGLTACTKLPAEKIVPYAAQPPEQFVPGKPLFYATAMPLGGGATGVLVESHMGPPHQGRGQTQPPRQPRRNRRLRASIRAGTLRPRPLTSGLHARPPQQLKRIPHSV